MERLGGGARLTLASVRWSDGVRRPPAARDECEDRGGIKAGTPPTLFKHAVINDKTHTHIHTHKARQLTPASPLLKRRPRRLWSGHFPNTSD